MSLSNFPANLAQTPSSAVIPQAPQQPVSSGQPARVAQPQPTMANKAPATEVTTNSVPASVAKAATQGGPVPLLASDVPKLSRRRGEQQKLVRTETMTRNIYQKSPRLELVRLATQGKGTIDIQIDTRAQFTRLCQYLKDGPVLPDGTPVRGLKINCDFGKLAREKRGEYVAPGALLGELLDASLCLASLDLGACEMGDADYKALPAFLADPDCGLESLYLDRCILSDDTALAFASGLAKNQSLKTLSLESTYMLQPSWARIANGLTSCKQLEKLVVQPTAAGSLPVWLVATIVDHVGSLRELSVSCAPRLSLYPEQAATEWRQGWASFCEAIAKSPKLSVLDLRGSTLSAADIDQLVRAIEKGGVVEQLELGDNALSAEQALKIAGLLARNKASNLAKGQSSGAAQATPVLADTSGGAPASTSSTSSTSDMRRTPDSNG